MAQLVVRDLEESVKRKLKQRAVRNGRSLEGEVREILRVAAAAAGKSAQSTTRKGFGTELAELFAGKVPSGFKIEEIRDEDWAAFAKPRR